MSSYPNITRELTIASDPAEINSVEAFLQQFVDAAGLNEDLAGDILIAGTEAVNNAILHGNRGQRDLKVHIRLQLVAGALQMEVQDQGGGFDSGATNDPTTEEHLLDDSGRGLLIIRHFMDELRFENGKTGQTAILTKKLA